MEDFIKIKDFVRRNSLFWSKIEDFKKIEGCKNIKSFIKRKSLICYKIEEFKKIKRFC